MSTAAQRSVTYAEYIAACVRNVAHKLRGEDVAVATLRLFSGILLYLVFAIALDHAFALNWQVRTGMLAVAALVAVWHTVRGIIIPLVRRVNEWYVARTIDRVVPELADGMTTVLQLERTSDDPLALVARPVVEDRVVRVLARVDVTERVGTDRLLHAWYLFAASVLLVCVGVLINSLLIQRSLITSLARVLVPWADIGYPTRTRIVDVRPGDDPELSKGIAGEDVTIAAMVEGAVPERVDVCWSTDGGKTWRRQPLERPLTSLDPWVTTLRSVEQTFIYYLQGGDCKTKTYTFTVLPVPVVRSIEVRYEPPPYTGLEPYTSDLPDIEAVEGTRVTVVATLPEPVRRAELIFGSDKRLRIPMHRVPGREDAVQGSFEVRQDDVYRIWFVLASGATNSNPPVYQIKCRKDAAPEVKIVEPARDLVDPPVPVDREIPVVVEARDDFGLRVVELVFDLPDRPSPHREVLFDGLKERSSGGSFTFGVRAAALGLKPGQELVYWAEAVDNKRPGAQKGQSQKYRIRFAAPEPAAQDQQQATEQRQGEEDKKQEEQQQEQRSPEESGEAKEAGQDQAAEEEQQRVEDPEQALEEIARFLEEQSKEEQAKQGQEQAGEQAEPDESRAEQQAQEMSRDQEQRGDQEQAEAGEKSGTGEAGEGVEAGEQQSGGERASEPSKEQMGEGERAGSEAGEQPGSKEASESGQGESGAGDVGQAQDGTGKEAGQGTDDRGKAGDHAGQQQGRPMEPGTPTGQDLPDLPEGAGLTGTRTESGGQGQQSQQAETQQGGPGEGTPDESGASGDSHGAGSPTGERGRSGGKAQPGEAATEGGNQSEPAGQQAGETGGASRGKEQSGGSQGQSGAGESGAGTNGSGKESGMSSSGGAQSGGAQGVQPGGQGAQTGQQGQGQQGGQQGQGQGQGQGAGGSEQRSGGAQPAGQGGEGRGAPTDQSGGPGKGEQGSPGGQGGERSASSQPGGGAPSGGAQPGQTPSGVAGQPGNSSVGGGAAPVAGTGERSGDAPGQRGAAGGAPGEGLERAQGGGEGAGQQTADAPARPSPELVLRELEDMLRNDRVDRRLLERLGWSKEDLERFVKYLKAKNAAAPRAAGSTPRGRLLTSGPGAGGGSEDAGLDIQQVRPPREYEELVEAYSRSLSAGAGKGE